MLITRSFILLSNHLLKNLPIRVLQRSRTQEIRSWMRRNLVKLNDEKTEFLLFGSRQQLSKVSLPFITIGDSQITPSSQARNLGVLFDSTMTLKPHISNIVRDFAYHHFISEILAK